MPLSVRFSKMKRTSSFTYFHCSLLQTLVSTIFPSIISYLQSINIFSFTNRSIHFAFDSVSQPTCPFRLNSIDSVSQQTCSSRLNSIDSVQKQTCPSRLISMFFMTSIYYAFIYCVYQQTCPFRLDSIHLFVLCDFYLLITMFSLELCFFSKNT